ncbi:MAG TPA: hypothetical protein VN577_17265 [Terriglobales bacterium]|nr:hypothetical protein [Terriglobales bacterium]
MPSVDKQQGKKYEDRDADADVSDGVQVRNNEDGDQGGSSQDQQ